MILELVVTSAKRALQAGRSGFAPVMRTRGMHPDLQSRLEAISGYRHIYPQGDPRNPVIRSHCVLESAAGKFSALSRLLDVGSDYSGRSNKLAHHIACDSNEVRSGLRSSPAAVMMSLENNGVFISRWEGDPQEKTAFEPFPYPPVSPAKCVAWERLAGDAGWAGVLVERTLKAVPTWIVVGANVDVLPLFAEALALMEPAKRWGVSFTTHALSDKGFLWKAAVDGSAEAKAAREQPNAALIDLTRPATVIEAGPYIQAARGLADVPWKPRTDINNAPPTDSPRVSAGTTPNPRVDLPPAVRPNEVAGGPPSMRPGPPQLVTPPPIARARGTAPTALPLPLGRDSTPSSRVPLIAASVLAAAILATCLGLFVDDRMRGDSSIIRQIAHALPRKEEQPKPADHTRQGTGAMAQGEQVETGGDSTKTANVGSDKPDDSHAPKNTPTVNGDVPAKPAAAAAPESKNSTPPETPPASPPAAVKPKDPSAAPSPPDNAAPPPPPPASADKALSFSDLKKLVEKTKHLPSQGIRSSQPHAGSETPAPVELIAFHPPKSAPTSLTLDILQQKHENDDTAPLVLHDIQTDGDRRSWKCGLASDDQKSCGSFELTPQGLSFAPTEHLSKAMRSQLADCCLLLRGEKPDECTYLQLSHPAYISPLTLTLDKPEKAPWALLTADAPLDSPYGANLLDPPSSGHLSMSVKLTCDNGTASTATFDGPFTLPIIIRTSLELPIHTPRVSVPCDLVVTRDDKSISVKALVNPFGNHDLFDQLRQSLDSANPQINFKQKFWSYASNELTALLSKHGMSRPTKKKQGINGLVSSLENTLEPKTSAVPFKTYVESLRNQILSSASLTKTAEDAVDARHPKPTSPPPDAATKEDAAPPPSKPPFDRDTEIRKDKEARLETWCIARLNELERRCSVEGNTSLDSWEPADQTDYATLFLWHRISRLESVLAALPKAADSPTALTAEALVQIKLVWPQSLLPEGASCHPETVLLQTQR